MYIVRDKTTRKIIHVNPAPVSQKLEGTDVYYLFDPATMEVGKAEFQSVPEYFDIDRKGIILPWTLERQIKEGVTTLPPELKAVGDEAVPKTLAEKVADGTVKLKPTEKLLDDRIEPKTVAEQVAEGLIKLTRTQVLDGDIIREMTDGEKAAAGLIQIDERLKVVGKHIVPKTPAELVKDKLLELASDEKIEGDDIIKLTPREMLREERINLHAYKQALIQRYTEASLADRQKELPDHLLLYAALGALPPDTIERCRKAASEHAKTMDKIARAIEKAATAEEADRIADLGDWPKAMPPRQRVVRVSDAA